MSPLVRSAALWSGAAGHCALARLISSRDASDYGRRIGRSGARGFICKAELSARTLAAVLEGAGR